MALFPHSTMAANIDCKADASTIFAGQRYHENLGLANATYPLDGLTQGYSLQKLTTLLNQHNK